MRVRWIVAVGVLLGASSCRDDAASTATDEARSWPAGTVVAVEDEPITADDVDRDSALIYHLALESTERDLRRKALANLTLPRAIGRVLGRAERADVERVARAERAELAAGSRPLPADARRLSGGYGDVGLAIWGTAIDTPPGTWTPLIEFGGTFAAALVHDVDPYEIPAGTEVDVEIVAWPYVDGDRDERIESAKDELKLTIVDPEWRRIVPERTQYRMGVHDS